MSARRDWKPRQDWMPLNAPEVCACIAVLAMQGRLSPADEKHIADYIAFRRTLIQQRPPFGGAE